MNIFQKISTLYNVSKNYGYSENDIIQEENKQKIRIPRVLREYYALLGRNKKINETHNRLLKLNSETGFSDDGYYVFYEENQAVVCWGINKNDMEKDNPKVYGNYDPENLTEDWFIDSETLEGFLLTMAYWNGALGGLKYNANYSNDSGIEDSILKNIENNWNEITGITNQQLRFFTNDDIEIIAVTTDLENTANGIYTGTNDKNKFIEILKKINIEWDYRSDKDNVQE
jgi:hypothetical protein